MPQIICYLPGLSMPVYGPQLSLGVGHVIGLDMYVIAQGNHAEQTRCPESAFVSPVPLKSYLLWIMCVGILGGLTRILASSDVCPYMEKTGVGAGNRAWVCCRNNTCS